MRESSIYGHLRQATEAIQAASDGSLPADATGYLDGAERLLSHHSDGDATGPEAMLHPTADALDTVQGRLSEIIEEAEGSDGPGVENLQTARAHIIQAILLLDEHESEGRPTSSWR